MKRKRRSHRSRCKRRFLVNSSKTDLAATDTSFRERTVNQFVAQPLMIPFAMIMGDKLGDSATEMAPTERNQPIPTLLFD